MQIHGAPLWLAATNCFVISGDGETGVIVDAPPGLDQIEQIVERAGIAPVALLATHGHVDHIGAAGAVVRRWSMVGYLHPDDDWLAEDPAAQLRMMFGMHPDGDYSPPDRYEALEDGQVLDLAGLAFEVLHTPGHTPGHVCFRVADEGLLLSGDHLFAGSIGRTDLPGGDYDTLMESMRDKIAPLPPETDVLPGHGPATTIARELAANPFLSQFRP
jgi:glyoxylase-like metal-dependent hydrolase (beta-lactamase superfamily II)